MKNEYKKELFDIAYAMGLSFFVWAITLPISMINLWRLGIVICVAGTIYFSTHKKIKKSLTN